MDKEIIIELPDCELLGNINIPKESKLLIVFAHGSGSSRFSPRNRYVANALNESGFATCLFDLLTEQEESIDLITRELRFNIPMLSKRLAQVTHWLGHEYSSYGFQFGYFGSSTGAAAALQASVDCKEVIAIVSRGGRPDLAQLLSKVTAATLLIVGGLDVEVIKLNEKAYESLQTRKELVIVPNATHLFEEPGALDKVIQLAINWFHSCL